MSTREVLVTGATRLIAHAIESSRFLPRVLTRVLLEGQLLEIAVQDPRVRETMGVDCSEELRGDPAFLAAFKFHELWHSTKQVVDLDRPEIAQKHAVAKEELRCSRDFSTLLLDVLCEEDEVFLKNGVMRFPDRRSLWIQLHEILLREDYYFETTTQSPYILDCGTHFGLAIYYFKSLYPNARIVGFEPVPALRALALENVARNSFMDVEILPYALCASEGPTPFFVSQFRSMAGSLTERRRATGEELIEIQVEGRPLSEFLREPVHFLKLDVEGSEDVVLEEAQDSLGRVQHIFCEYHHGGGLEGDRLARLLLLLERSGFDTQIDKSYGYGTATRVRPMAFVPRPYSAAIWAKNRNWD